MPLSPDQKKYHLLRDLVYISGFNRHIAPPREDVPRFADSDKATQASMAQDMQSKSDANDR
jgi:hypothetical protein